MTKQLLIGLAALNLLIACAPTTSSSNPSAPSSQAQSAPSAQSASLPFTDAATGSWEAALRDTFVAVRSANLATLENLDVIVPGSSATSKLKLGFTPLEREKVTAVLSKQGQRTLEGFFCEAMRNASFEKVEMIEDRGTVVTVYFRYRTAEFATVDQIYGTSQTFGVLDQGSRSFQTAPMIKEAQWRFAKISEKWVLVFDPGTLGKLASPRDFFLYLEISINQLLEKLR